jgi:acyl-CoA thioester hydrolase
MTLERTDESGILYANGGAKTVWVNYREEKSAPLPETLRAIIG